MSGLRRKPGPTGESVPAAFVVECPGCQAHVAVTRGLVGRSAGCPRCQAAFLVPVPGPEERLAPRPASEVRRAAPAVATPAPLEAARPEPAVPLRSPDAPLAFSEPPVPSTRRLRAEAPSPAAAAPTNAASPIPNPMSMAGRTPAVVADGRAFQEPVRVVRSGGVEIELRRLPPEERRARRARRNLIILVVGAALLVALVVSLGKGGR